MTAPVRWAGARHYVTQQIGGLPDPATIAPAQLSGWLCALCRGDLADLARTRLVGSIRVDVGTVRESVTELWACAPDCSTIAIARLRLAKPRTVGAPWPTS